MILYLKANQTKGLKWCGTELRKLYTIDQDQTKIIADEFHKLKE